MAEQLPLDRWHRDAGARMVEFAGYDMPIQYDGIIAEHLHVREAAGLFDVSHMGQLSVHGEGAGDALEALMPGDFRSLKVGRARYSMLLDENGGIIDDLIVTRIGENPDRFAIVVNGATKHGDIEEIEAALPEGVELRHHEDQALLALQGPQAADVLAGHIEGVDTLSFMQGGLFDWGEEKVWVSRSGYTGEDGFEISVRDGAAVDLAEALVADERVKPIGLGARDSLRLEAGLPLYGHDLDTKTHPVSADLGFAISKRRRSERGFRGADPVLAELTDGPVAKRVGFTVEGRQPVREGSELLDAEGTVIGRITSGGHSPSLGKPIAMGYVATKFADEGTTVQAQQRGKLFDLSVTKMPFVPHRYHRKQGAAK